MEIIPAIDIKDGKCVRLVQGEENSSTVYGDDPVSMAEKWTAQGARRIHIVDLNAAFGKSSGTTAILTKICSAVKAAVQFGGGLRTREALRATFDAGAAKAVVGTVAIENPSLLADFLKEFGGERIIVAVDARGGRIATRGWKQLSQTSVGAAAEELKSVGVREILYTDIARDGMMSGPDLETLQSLAETGLSVIASGGIASARDIELLLSVKPKPLSGAIIGKALYEGRLTLHDALALTGVR